MNIEKLLREIRDETKNLFPRARLRILEKFPAYLKARIILDEKFFIEVRINAKNKRSSYVLVKDGKRFAGFDNLGGWHSHPFENPNIHKRVKSHSLHTALSYFKKII